MWVAYFFWLVMALFVGVVWLLEVANLALFDCAQKGRCVVLLYWDVVCLVSCFSP